MWWRDEALNLGQWENWKNRQGCIQDFWMWVGYRKQLLCNWNTWGYVNRGRSENQESGYCLALKATTSKTALLNAGWRCDPGCGQWLQTKEGKERDVNNWLKTFIYGIIFTAMFVVWLSIGRASLISSLKSNLDFSSVESRSVHPLNSTVSGFLRLKLNEAIPFGLSVVILNNTTIGDMTKIFKSLF